MSESEEKWYSSGRGIFKRDAGFQIATMPIVPNWQEDTAMVVSLLNKGEKLDALARAAGGVLSGLHEREHHNPHDGMWKHHRAELIRLLAECGVVPDGANESPEKVE